jgi:hypothetical protein
MAIPPAAVIARESGQSSTPQQMYGAVTSFHALLVVTGLPAFAGNDAGYLVIIQ